MSDPTSRVVSASDNENHSAALKALPEAVREMTSETSPEELLRNICTTAIDILDASTGSLLIWDAECDQLVFRVTGAEVREKLEGKRMPSDAGIAGWVFTHRTPLIVPDVGKDERFFGAIDESLGHRTSSLIAAPLMTRHNVLGVIEVLNKRSEHGFDMWDMDVLTALASQAAIAIDNVRMSSELKRQRQQLVTVQQEIYKKLARDLHDGPSQWVASVSMSLEYIVHLMDIDPTQARAELDRARHKLDKAANLIRNLMFELRPVLLESNGLQAALKHYIDNLNENDGMNIRLSMDDLQARLDPATERAVFDIIREALSNARRHAHTPNVWVNIHMDGTETLTIMIRDDGLGFDPEVVRRDYSTRGSLGMLNMSERAELLGGSLTVDSVPSEGTTITLTIPLPQADA